MAEPLAAWLWSGEGLGARLARVALAPAAWVFRGVVAFRGALYDQGVLRAHGAALPVVALGNLTVGGTGKTPVASWVAGELARRGARPAVVLRGYGGDESLVHERLRPDVPVIVAADRVAGVARAAARGATVAVLDDAFQHRRVRRDADLVLVSADAWRHARRMLPAGPWREPLKGIARASAVLVTRKAASLDAACGVTAELRAIAPRLPIAIVHLALGPLRAVHGSDELPLAALTGRAVLAVAAVGEPHAFVAQLEAAGASVRAAVFRDHHRFSERDATQLAAGMQANETPVCTLKDAVKLAPLWPRAAAPLWYVSQHVVAERNREVIDALLDEIVRAQRRGARPREP